MKAEVADGSTVWTTGMVLDDDGAVMVSVSEEEYDKLQKAGLLLAALHTAGVTGWDGWDLAVGLFNKAIGADTDDRFVAFND